MPARPNGRWVSWATLRDEQKAAAVATPEATPEEKATTAIKANKRTRRARKPAAEAAIADATGVQTDLPDTYENPDADLPTVEEFSDEEVDEPVSA